MKHKLKIISLFVIFVIISGLAMSQNDSAKSEMAFDFGLARDWKVNLWPLIKYNKTKENKDLQILFSDFRYHYNYSEPRKNTYFFPAYWYDSTSANVDFRLFSTYYPSVFHYNKDFTVNSRSFRFFEIAPEIDLLEFTKSPDGLFIQNNILFLLWYKNDRIAEKSHLIFFPLYWSFKDNCKKTNTVFPLCSFGTFNNNHNKYYAVSPFFWHFKSEEATKNIFFPIFWNKTTIQNNDVKKSNVIFPVFWSFKDSKIKNNILFPLFWSLKNSIYKSTTLAPIFSIGYSTDEQRKHIMITPLFWHLNNYEEIKNILFPIWWYKKNVNDSNGFVSNILFPVYWSYKDRENNNKTIFPVFWSYKDSFYKSVTFIPLFSIGNSRDDKTHHLMVTPLFWHFKDNYVSNNVLFPFFWVKKKFMNSDTSFSNVIFPLYWSYIDKERNYKILFPVTWGFENPNYKSFTFVPFFSSGHSIDNSRKHLMIASLFWHKEFHNGYKNVLFPVWWQNKQYKSSDTTYSNVFFPFYWSYKEKYYSYKIVFPLSWNYKNPDYKSFTFIPFFSTGHSVDNKNKHLVVSTLFWHFKNDERCKNILFPLWYQNKGYSFADTTDFNYVFPLYLSYKDKTTKNKVFLPILWSLKNDYSESFTVLPLFSAGHSNNNKNKHLMITPVFWHFKNPDGFRNILFPVWWYKNETIVNKISRSNVIFPVYWSFNNSNHDNKVLFPILWNLKNTFYQSFTILPLFSKGHSALNEDKHLMIGTLYWNFKTKDKRKNILFPLWWNKKLFTSKDTITTNYIFPIFWAKKNNEKNNKVLFPVIWSLNNTNRSSLTIFPLFSSGFSNDMINKHIMVTPLFWFIKKKDFKRITLFPAFNYYSGIDSTKKFNLLVLLFRYKSRTDFKSVSFIAPLCEYREAENYKSFHLAPVVWYKKTMTSQYFSVQPFYYHRKDSYSENYNILWYLYAHKNFYDVKKRTIFFWGAIYNDKYVNHDHEFRFLYLLYANVHKDGNIEKSIFPFYYYSKEQDGEKSFSLLFYFYNSARRKILNKNDFYEEQRIFWIIRLRSNYKSLLQRGVIKDKKDLKGA